MEAVEAERAMRGVLQVAWAAAAQARPVTSVMVIMVSPILVAEEGVVVDMADPEAQAAVALSYWPIQGIHYQLLDLSYTRSIRRHVLVTEYINSRLVAERLRFPQLRQFHLPMHLPLAETRVTAAMKTEMP
jgi:hypothetical protein